MEHMGQHALSVPVSGGQTSNLLSQCTYVSLKDYSPLGRLIPLTCQLSHLCSESLNLGVVIPLKLTSVIVSLDKSTRHTSQATFHSIDGLHYCKHGTHSGVITILCFCWPNLQRPSSCLLPWVSCNTLKFASLEIELEWFNYIILCSWKHRKIIFFIILKFIIGFSNIVCIHAGAYDLMWCLLIISLCVEGEQSL
jgi:hypothetical protein